MSGSSCAPFGIYGILPTNQAVEKVLLWLKITVLIVDDHQIFRHGLRDSMSLDDDIRLSRSLGWRDGFAVARELAPRVVLADVNLPGINGCSWFSVSARSARRAGGHFNRL